MSISIKKNKRREKLYGLSGKKKYGENIYLVNLKNFDSVFSISSLPFNKILITNLYPQSFETLNI